MNNQKQMSSEKSKLFNMEDIQLLDGTRILGEGAFSEVVLVKHKKTQKLYAMKKLDLVELSDTDR